MPEPTRSARQFRRTAKGRIIGQPLRSNHPGGQGPGLQQFVLGLVLAARVVLSEFCETIVTVAFSSIAGGVS